MAVYELPQKSAAPPEVDGIPCREERVAMVLEDGAVWVLEPLLVPLGGQSLSMRAAAWSLRQARSNVAHGRQSAWRMVRPATVVA